MHLARTLLPAGLALSALAQCSQPAPAPPESPPPPPRYTGDLPVLQERGVLRVIVPPEPIAHIPRSGEPVTIDYDVAHGLSEALKLKLELVKVGSFGRDDGEAAGGRRGHRRRQPGRSPRSGRRRRPFPCPISTWTST